MTVSWSEMEGAQNSETGNLEQALKSLFCQLSQKQIL